MTDTDRSPSIQRTARTAGLLYLALAVLGGFAEFFVRKSIIVRDDAAATVANLTASQGLFRMGIVAELAGQVVFVLLALTLYRTLKSVDKRHAVAMVAFVLVAVGITCLNMLNQFAALYLTSGAGHLAAFDAPQLQSLVLAFLDLHQAGYIIAQVFFGLWLLPLGYLVYRSGFLPRLIGVLLMVACAGYLADVATFFLAPGFGVVFSEFTFVGELALMGWLLVRGVNVTCWEARALRPA